MPYNDSSKLHAIMFLIISNIMVYNKMIMEWLPFWISNMAAKNYEIFHRF